MGRNDPCWCGSGRKYKKCHMGRENQEPLNIWEVEKEQRKLFSTKDCLVPDAMKVDCSGTIVKAHTVPRSGSLRKIAHNDHVYSFIPSLENMIKHQGRLQPELVGINRASTFTGFCSKHDTTIFSKVETQSFSGSQEQCFLLAYRALAREIYTKRALVASSSLRREADRGKSLEQQHAIQEKNLLIDIGASTGLRDLEYYKRKFDEILLTSDFSGIRAYIVELASPPPIMCSSSIFPEQDFEGNTLQDLTDPEVVPHLLSFTSFYGGHCGAVVFAWLSDCDHICQSFINSLRRLRPDRMADGLIRFFFEFCENLHIEPKWWENLEENKRDFLIDRLSGSAKPFVDRKLACLADDGIRYDNWPISDLKAIGF